GDRHVEVLASGGGGYAPQLGPRDAGDHEPDGVDDEALAVEEGGSCTGIAVTRFATVADQDDGPLQGVAGEVARRLCQRKGDGGDPARVGLRERQLDRPAVDDRRRER